MHRLLILALMIVNLVACSSFSRQRSPSQDETKVLLKDQRNRPREAPPQAHVTGEKGMVHVSPDDAEGQKQATQMKDAVAAAAQHIEASHGKVSRESGPVAAEKAYGWLRNGNARFVRGTFRADGASAKDRLRLASQQRPHSAVFTCSDSRVSPEVIFDQKLGEIYVVRTGELILDKNVQESLEYAVGILGANLVLLMGADSCGDASVAAALGNELLERSAILRDAVASGEVKVIKAVYRLDSGNVEFQ